MLPVQGLLVNYRVPRSVNDKELHAGPATIALPERLQGPEHVPPAYLPHQAVLPDHGVAPVVFPEEHRRHVGDVGIGIHFLADAVSGFVQLEPEGTDRAMMMRDGQCFRIVESNCWSAERRIEECDRDGVDVRSSGSELVSESESVSE